MNATIKAVFIPLLLYEVFCTIDVNLSELEYLAAHLDEFECRRLVAALHYNSYELPESIEAAERKVDEEIPCLRQLLHWNSSPGEGRGQSHEDIEHRLRQLNRNDLADWIGKTTFQQLGKDLEQSMNKPFGELGEQETEGTYPITNEPREEPKEEDPWLPIDTILLALLGTLLAALLILMAALIIHHMKLCYYGKDKYMSLAQEEGRGGNAKTRRKKNMKKRKRKKRKQAVQRNAEASDETEKIDV